MQDNLCDLSRAFAGDRPPLEVADVFRRFGPAWRAANAGHLSLAQWRVMKAVELCRTAELGGHVEHLAGQASGIEPLISCVTPAFPTRTSKALMTA